MTMNLFQNKTIKLSAIREAVQRDGKCFNRIIMGILRNEWIEPTRLESIFEIIYVVCRRYNNNWRILQCTDCIYKGM